MKDTDRNYSIDLFRLLGAFSVVIIHAKYGTLSTNAISNIFAINIRLLSRWAVPFFFLISGFYLEKRFKLLADQSLLKSLKNLFSIAFVVNVVFLIFLVFTDPGFLAQLMDLRIILEGSYLHLWFIGSLILGYLIVWYIIKSQLENYLLPIALFFTVGVLVLDIYSSILRVPNKSDLSRFLQSIPFLIFGFLRARDNQPRIIYSITGSILLIGVGIVLQLSESVLVYQISDYSPYKVSLTCGTIIFSLGMFYLSIQLPIKKNLFSAIGKKYSLLIYLYHPIIYSLLYFLLAGDFFKNKEILLWISPLINLGITIMVFYAIDRLAPRWLHVGPLFRYLFRGKIQHPLQTFFFVKG